MGLLNFAISVHKKLAIHFLAVVKPNTNCISQRSRCLGHSAHQLTRSTECMDGCSHMVNPSSLCLSNAHGQIWTDISLVGYRAYAEDARMVQGAWNPEEDKLRIFFLELRRLIKLSTPSSGATQLTTDLYQKQPGDTSHQDTHTPQHNSRHVEQGSEDSRVGIEKRNIPQASDLGGFPWRWISWHLQ